MKNLFRKLMPKAAWEYFRMRRVRWTQARFKPYTTRQRYGKCDLTVLIADPMAKAWYGKGGEELTEITLLKSGQLKSGAVVFDLGAHQGIVALRLADIVGQTGRIIAAEANPHHARIAEQNCVLNNATNVVVESMAVGAVSGELTFSRDWDGQSVGKGDAKVLATTVDDLASKYGWPKVLYIDVEGYECEVLAGAHETLKRRPDLYIEVHAGCGLEEFGGSLESLLTYLPSYRLVAIKPANSADTRDLICELNPSLQWLRERFYLVALNSGELASGSLSLRNHGQ